MRQADHPTVSQELLVAAPPERVWPLVSDIAFPVAPSDELQDVRWADGAPGAPRVGRTFVGVNRNEYFGEWETTSTVIECDEPRAFAWAVGDPADPNTTWRFTLAPADGGTLVSQWVRLGSGWSGITIAIARMPDKEEKIVARRLEYWRDQLRGNLEAIKARVEGD